MSHVKEQTSKTIKVLEEDIEYAVAGNSGHCMIADAIKAELPEASFVTVDLATIRYTNRRKGERYICLTPVKCQRALLDFDKGVPIEPFQFRMPRPAQVMASKTWKKGDSKKASLTKVGSKREGAVPQKRGGSTPPSGALTSNVKAAKTSGLIRAYGLRQMGV
jgi:hypothetical protein